MVWFQFSTRIIGEIVTNNGMTLEFLETLLWLLYTCRTNCAEGGISFGWHAVLLSQDVIPSSGQCRAKTRRWLRSSSKNYGFGFGASTFPTMVENYRAVELRRNAWLCTDNSQYCLNEGDPLSSRACPIQIVWVCFCKPDSWPEFLVRDWLALVGFAEKLPCRGNWLRRRHPVSSSFVDVSKMLPICRFRVTT